MALLLQSHTLLAALLRRRTRGLSSEGDLLSGCRLHCIPWKSASNPEVRMFGNYGTGARGSTTFPTTFGMMQPSAAALDICDEEIAYQLQLEAIAESSHHHSRSKSQPSSSSSHEASSSGSRVVPNSGARNPGRYSGTLPTNADIVLPLHLEVMGLRRHSLGISEQWGSPCCDCAGGAPIPTRPMNDAERMVWFARLNLRQTDGAAALPNDGAGSSTVGRDSILEMECVICTEMRPYTSFISTTGEHMLQCNNPIKIFR